MKNRCAFKELSCSTCCYDGTTVFWIVVRPSWAREPTAQGGKASTPNRISCGGIALSKKSAKHAFAGASSPTKRGTTKRGDVGSKTTYRPPNEQTSLWMLGDTRAERALRPIIGIRCMNHAPVLLTRYDSVSALTRPRIIRNLKGHSKP
jgi:hypothetical protein